MHAQINRRGRVQKSFSRTDPSCELKVLKIELMFKKEMTRGRVENRDGPNSDAKMDPIFN